MPERWNDLVERFRGEKDRSVPLERCLERYLKIRSNFLNENTKCRNEMENGGHPEGPPFVPPFFIGGLRGIFLKAEAA